MNNKNYYSHIKTISNAEITRKAEENGRKNGELDRGLAFIDLVIAEEERLSAEAAEDFNE